MSSTEPRIRLADLIQQILEGKVTPEAALKTTAGWNDLPWKDKVVKNAWHTLKHFKPGRDRRNVSCFLLCDHASASGFVLPKIR